MVYTKVVALEAGKGQLTACGWWWSREGKSWAEVAAPGWERESVKPTELETDEGRRLNGPTRADARNKR